MLPLAGSLIEPVFTSAWFPSAWLAEDEEKAQTSTGSDDLVEISPRWRGCSSVGARCSASCSRCADTKPRRCV